MRKIAALLLMVSLAVSAVGCTKTAYTALDYFSFTENAYYEYEGDGHELAAMQTYTGYVRDGRLQRRNSVNEDYPAQTEIFEYKNGTITNIRADVSTYYIEDATFLPAVMDLPVLREPIEQGAEWGTRDGNKFKITAVNKRVTVPYGTFNVIEVTQEIPGLNIMQKDYYAPGVGLIETRYSISDGPWIISRLKNITKDISVDIPALAYYPDPDDGEIYERVSSITIKTNGDIKAEIEKLLTSRSPDGAYDALLSKGKINSITVERANDTSESFALIDFSPEVYEINDSETAEYNWLYAVGNTVGAAYGVAYVCVWVDGGPFSGTFVQLTVFDMIAVGD